MQDAEDNQPKHNTGQSYKVNGYISFKQSAILFK